MLAALRREWDFLRRSPWDIAQVTWIPWALLAMVAVVLSQGVLRNVPIAVVDQDRSPESRSLIRKLDAARGVYVRAMPPTLAEAWPLLRGTDIFAVVHVPPDATRRIKRGDPATLLAYYNASHLTIGQSASREIAGAVQALNAEGALGRSLYLQGRSGASAVPVSVQSTILFNPERSYARFLEGLLFPAILQLALCLAAVGAVGRELRDGSARQWLDGSGGRLLPAVTGKLVPYLAAFMLYGALAVLWSAHLGGGIAGSFVVLLAGYLLAYLAYAAIGLLLLGLTRSMATALSLSGLYAGVSLAFSGGTFPVIDGPLFTQLWSRLLPFTAYAKLQAQQLDIGAPWSASLWHLATLLVFVLAAGLPGLWLLGRAARDPASWGLR